MSARGRARETISDKRVVEGVTRKKTQSKAVRDALVYRKNLSTLIEESVGFLMKSFTNTDYNPF